MAILQENIEVRKNAAGGKGEVSLEHLLGKEQMGDKCSTFARVTIKRGSSLGYHQRSKSAPARRPSVPMASFTACRTKTARKISCSWR